jgi:hypothetical protein
LPKIIAGIATDGGEGAKVNIMSNFFPINKNGEIIVTFTINEKKYKSFENKLFPKNITGILKTSIPS